MRAAAEKGRAEALAPIAPQPPECAKKWEKLTRGQLVGHDALSGIKRYEDYIDNTINPQKLWCWQFNEDIRSGAARPISK